MPKKAAVQTDKEAVEHFLTRSVENVYPTREKLAELLASGKRITVYTGVDPTGPTLHMGHLIWLKKLAELQKLGHRVILLIGDFTAMIGDPTDKGATRKRQTREEVLANCKTYQKQASKFLSFDGPNAAELKFNSEWLAKMSFTDVVELAAHFTVQQMSERDMFETRIKEGKPVYLHEFLYPLMQGYDSVAMDVDLEIGGNDQTFNMLAGRDLQREINHKEKFVLATKLLVDSSGKKMGKSEGNMVTLTDKPEEIFGKIMSWPDEMIWTGWELCTSVSMEHIALYKRGVDSVKENPMTHKRRLAHQVVVELYDVDAANLADDYFTRVHQMHVTPEDAPEFKVAGPTLLADVLVASTLVSSKTEARRQIEQGGVKVDGEVVKDVNATVNPPAVIQKGKRHFVRLV